MLSSFSNRLSVFCATALLIWSSGCTRSEDEGREQVLYVSHRDDIKTLDPATSYDSISWDVVPSIYDTLFQYSYLDEPFKIVPLLAADLPKYSNDRLTVTIPIRKNIRFSDDPAFKDSNGKGRLLRAQDFIFAWKRLAIPSIQSQGWWIFDGKILGINTFQDKLKSAKNEEIPGLMNTPVQGLQALDDHTLQIRLTRPYPQLLYVLAMPFTAPVPHEAVSAYGDENGNLHDHPVGTGPFILKKWSRGHEIVLERNPNYFEDFYPTSGHSKYQSLGLLEDSGKPLPQLDRIQISVIKEEQPAWLKFLRGEMDLASIPKDSFQSAIAGGSHLSDDLKKKGIRLFVENENTFFYISFNMKDAVVGKNKYLRQAIASAIDREKFVELFRNGRGLVPTSALPPGIPDRPDDVKLKYDYNPSRARELLKKAGFPNGKGLPVLKFDMRGSDSLNRQMGEYFTQQLKAVGIELKVVFNTFPAYLEKAKQGNLQVSLGGWSMDYPDAENTYQLLYGPNQSPGPNESNFNHPEMNRLYDRLAAMESGPARMNVIRKIEELIQEESPWAMLYYRTQFHLDHGWLKGRRPNQTILNAYKYYRVDQERKKILKKEL